MTRTTRRVDATIRAGGSAPLRNRNQDPDHREDWYSVEGIGTTPDPYKAFFVWNNLWKVDYKTRKRDGEVSLPNSQAVPLIHPDGKKLYCGGQWHALSVYDVDSLKHIDDVELGHSMAGIGMRFVSTDKDLSAPGATSQDP